MAKLTPIGWVFLLLGCGVIVFELYELVVVQPAQSVTADVIGLYLNSQPFFHWGVVVVALFASLVSVRLLRRAVVGDRSAGVSGANPTRAIGLWSALTGAAAAFGGIFLTFTITTWFMYMWYVLLDGEEFTIAPAPNTEWYGAKIVISATLLLIAALSWVPLAITRSLTKPAEVEPPLDPEEFLDA